MLAIKRSNKKRYFDILCTAKDYSKVVKLARKYGWERYYADEKGRSCIEAFVPEEKADEFIEALSRIQGKKGKADA